RDRQKSYADNRRKPLEFEVGDRVMLKVSPWKGVIRFGKKGKLAPSGVHDTFHVSNLKKCLADASLHVPLDKIMVDKTLRFVEEPVEIMDREVKGLKCSRIVVVRVHLGSKRGRDFLKGGDNVDYLMSMVMCDVIFNTLNVIVLHWELVLVWILYYILCAKCYLIWIVGKILGVEWQSYACSDSLLLTPLCCDDIHDVTPRVSALAGCDNWNLYAAMVRGCIPDQHIILSKLVPASQIVSKLGSLTLFTFPALTG
ncbi:hypothetical protein Tco_1136570, partial [Tanacetum coccineum]